jgi:hypothetical protein
MSINSNEPLTREEIDSMERILRSLSCPKGQAFSDYVEGKGLDANPYSQGTAEYHEYRLEMHANLLRAVTT